MRKIFKFILTLPLITIFYSCLTSKMQIVTLDNDKIIKNDTMWISKDSIADVSFNFYSRSGEILFIIDNKISKPVFLDLKNSFVSVNEFKKNLWTDVSQVSEDLTIKQYRAINLKTQNPINGTISRPERIIMIAPKSGEAIRPLVNLKTKMYETANYQMKQDSIKANWTTNSSKKTAIKNINFDKSNSPTLMRVFITLSRTEDFKEPIYYDFNFWVSNIMEMDARQATKSDYPLDYCNGFYSIIGPENIDKHPYKKAWRFYIPEQKQ